MSGSLEFIRDYWSQVVLFFSAIWGIYLYVRNSQKRKNSLKIDENIILEGDIKNVSALLKLHRETIEELRKSFDDLKKDYIERGIAYDDLETRFNKVTETLEIYDRKIKSLSQENLELIQKVKRCEECPIENDELIKSVI